MKQTKQNFVRQVSTFAKLRLMYLIITALLMATAKSTAFARLKQKKVSKEKSSDTKRVSKQLTVGAEIGIPGLVKAQVEYVKAQCGKENEKKKNWSANSSVGDWSANSSVGYGSANSSVGYGSANVSTGFLCRNESGTASINVGWGKDNLCKGKIGAYIVLGEFGEFDGKKYPLIGAKMGLIDGKTLKEDTWYTLKNGEFVEVKE